jgi:hypothetical protein
MLKTWIGGNGLTNVVPPSRLNEQVSMFVASSNDIRRTMCPATCMGSIATLFDWTV